jgi:hypothetical protein
LVGIVVLRSTSLGDVAERLDAERERVTSSRDVLHLAREHAGLDRRADGDDLVRVHAAVGILAEEALHELLHLRDADRAADQHDLVDVARRDTRVLAGRPHRLERALDQVVDELLELRAREPQVQVLRPGRVRRDVRQVDLGLGHGRELDLRLFGGLLQALHRHRVLGEIDALVLLELFDEVAHDPVVDVVAAQVRVAVGREHLDGVVADLEHADVEGAAAEVVHGDLLVLLLVERVGERGRGRLVHQPQHLEACDRASVLGRLALRVVEVRGHRDDGLGHRLAEVRLRGDLQLLQDHRGDLRRRVRLAAGLDLDELVLARADLVGDELLLARHLAHAPAHEALDRVDRVERVGDRLAAGDLADQPLPVFGERDDRRRGPPALLVRDDLRLAAFHDGDHRVGRAQVDADHAAHRRSSQSLENQMESGACASFAKRAAS